MCGIAGIARFDGPADPGAVRAMVAALAHRGPDGEGFFAEDGVALGMRRLAIIDLSAAGDQPMPDETGEVQVVFNGEIYNFMDLRSRFLALGHRFRGRSDTEVLVHGYQEYGAAGLAMRLEGMFAFALLDRPRRKLFLVRDHFGVKPLYLRRRPGGLSFASEIRALALDGSGRPAVDPSFVGSYLRVGYVPSPRTAFRGVMKLEPGTALEVDLASGAENATRYYELQPLVPEAVGEDLLPLLRDALNLAVRRQLVADVPVGVFLSGGLDSSTLSAIASRHVSRLDTFSIRFALPEAEDEAVHAQRVARVLGASNRVIELPPSTFQDLERIVESLEEPLADSAVLPLWHLCRGTAASVKVALSGEGGDEALGGYPRYFWGAMAERVGGKALRFPGLVAALARLVPERAHGPLNVLRRARKFAETAHLPEAERYLSWFDVFSAPEREALCPGSRDAAAERVDGLFRRARELGLDAVQRLQFVDFSTMLLDNLLLKSDKLAMAHSLEVRVPMLDRQLAELGLGLPAQAKVGRGGRPLLRRAVRADLPRSIASRPKRGFEIPVNRWLREESTAEIRRSMQDGALVRSLGFSRPAIAELVERHERGEDLGRRLFSLLTLELWARRYCG